MDKQLADTRRRDELLRSEKITAQERDTLNNLLKSGDSAAIQKFVDADPARAEQLGLKPSAKVLEWYSDANLKTLYPDMTDTERFNIRNSMLDKNGNYRSDLYQTLYLNNYGLGQQKQTWQQGMVERDSSGNIIGGHGLLYQKALEAEKAYRPYNRGNLLSSYQGYIPPAAPGTSGNPPTEQRTKVNVKDKDGNTILVYPSSIPDLIKEGTLPAGTVAPTATVASTPVTPTPPAATTPAPTPTFDMKPFTDWTTGKTDVLGKAWQGYVPIEGTSYNALTPEERKKQYGNVQNIGTGTLYGYKY